MISLVLVGLSKGDLEKIQTILNSQRDMKIIGQGFDGYDAIHLVETLKPDIALLDVSLSLLNAADATRSLKRLSPKTKIVIMANSSKDVLVLKAIHYGAAGYLLKRSELIRIHWLIRIVYFGYSLMSPEIAAQANRMFLMQHDAQETRRDSVPWPVIKTRPFPRNISRLELEVISYIGQGFSTKEIAESLKLKVGTIRNHITSIYQKTGLRSQTQVAIYAHNLGLKIEPE